MKLIVGLGNPGREYVHTRHNAGFEVMDAIADHVSADISQKKFKALIDKVRIGNESVLLMKPPDVYEQQRRSGSCSHGFLSSDTTGSAGHL